MFNFSGCNYARWGGLAVSGFALAVLAGCGGDDGGPDPVQVTPPPVQVVTPPAPAPTTPAQPQDGPLPADALADYQLGGAYPPAAGVTVVVRDSTDSPAPGLFNICYVNGFQTQPGEDWPTALLVLKSNGTPLTDPGWPDEHLLDISTAQKREDNARLRQSAIQTCADKGFDAIEFDNLDSYTRSKGSLSLDNALAFAALLVAEARNLGLLAAQKNTTELGTRGRDETGFSFAIAESCHRWDECAAYTDVYGAGQVLGIEYTDELRGTFAQACANPARPASMILRDPLLLPSGELGHVFQACD